jgi:hypothetical protein
MERPLRSSGRRSPMAPGMLNVCEAEKTSAVIVFCEEKGFGGEDEVELLRDPRGYGLLERLEGLVLLGLGPPAISSCVSEVSWRAWREQRREPTR